MARERKLHLLHLSFDTLRDQVDVDKQLSNLERLLNDGWDILQAMPLGAAGGMTSVSPGPGAATERTSFARWTALVVLERQKDG